MKKYPKIEDLRNAAFAYQLYDKPMAIKITANEYNMAERWVKEMQDANLSNEQMLEVLKIAKEKYELLIGIAVPFSFNANEVQWCESCQSWYDYVTTPCCPQCGN